MKRSTIFFFLVGIALVGGVYAWKEYRRPVANANELAVSASVSASELLAAFQQDEAGATVRFVGITEQVIEVVGTIGSIEDVPNGISNVTLTTDDAMAGVICEFGPNERPLSWKVGDEVRLKGVCTGMLMDVILVRCVPVERSLP